MKRMIAIAAVVLLVGMGCGGDTHESLAVQGLDVMKQFTAVLEGIKDEATAKAAKPQLKTIIAKMNDLKERQKKLGTPTETELKTTLDKHGKEMEEVQQKMMTNMMRIGFDPKIRAELDDIEKDMQKGLN